MKVHPDRLRRLFRLSRSPLSISLNIGDVPTRNTSPLQLIQNLFKQNEHNTRSLPHNSSVVQEALSIFHNTKTDLQNHALVNVLLRGLSHFRQPEKVSALWSAIDTLS